MLSPLYCPMYLQDILKNTLFAQYQIVQGKTTFCKVFLQEIVAALNEKVNSAYPTFYIEFSLTLRTLKRYAYYTSYPQ